MYHKLRLIIYAITPLIIGNIVNVLICTYQWYGFSILAISLCFCVYWIILGYKSANYSKSLLESTLIGNSIALICCDALIFSQVMNGGYVPSANIFLPMVRFAAIDDQNKPRFKLAKGSIIIPILL